VDEERGRYGFERPPLDSFIHHVHSSNGHCARVRDARFFRVAKRTKVVTLAAPQTVNGDINSVCVAASTRYFARFIERPSDRSYFIALVKPVKPRDHRRRNNSAFDNGSGFRGRDNETSKRLIEVSSSRSETRENRFSLSRIAWLKQNEESLRGAGEGQRRKERTEALILVRAKSKWRRNGGTTRGTERGIVKARFFSEGARRALRTCPVSALGRQLQVLRGERRRVAP